MSLETAYTTAAGLVAFRNLAANHNACQPALDYLDACIAAGLTLQQANEQCLARAPNDALSFWTWVRASLTTGIGVNFREKLTDLVTHNNPRMAAHLDLYYTDLSANEIAMVTSRWSATDLPNIARQLADGTVTRARGA